AIYDPYRHPTGAEALRAVAAAIQINCRIADVVCRYGGEEFAIIAANTPAPNASILGERLRETISKIPLTYRRTPFTITASFGIADPILCGSQTVLEAADQALYKAKEAGRNRVAIAGTPLEDAVNN